MVSGINRLTSETEKESRSLEGCRIQLFKVYTLYS